VFSQALCLIPSDEDEYRIYGSIFSEKEAHLEMFISPCSLPNPADCQPAAFLNNLSFILQYPDIDQDLTKLENFSY
jgi:hypothetical protein